MIVIVSTTLTEKEKSSSSYDVVLLKNKIDKIKGSYDKFSKLLKLVSSNVIDSGIVDNIGIYICDIDSHDEHILETAQELLGIEFKNKVLSYSVGYKGETVQICNLACEMEDVKDVGLSIVANNLCNLANITSFDTRKEVANFLEGEFRK